MGPETSWRVVCADDDPTMACGLNQDPHGPLDGKDADKKDDNYTLNVNDCSRPGSGLLIELEDPGRDRNAERNLAKRPRSVLSISRADPENNECVVSVTEYPNSGEPKELKVQENCAGTSASPGSCEVEGKFNSNGYAFEGSLRCDAMKFRGNGVGAWALRGADGDEVVLQIASCD